MAERTDERGGEHRRRAGLFGAIESPEQVIMNVAFGIVVVAICWGVLSRYVVPTPATWVEEVTSIAFSWLIFIGAAEVHRRGQHVSVDVLTAHLPPGTQLWLSRAIQLLVVLFCFYVAWLGARHAIASHASRTSLLRIPLSVSAAGFTIGFSLIGLRGLQRLIFPPRAQPPQATEYL
jgi:TRAP-type transport system small permease protein